MIRFTCIAILFLLTGAAKAQQASTASFPEKESAELPASKIFHAKVINAVPEHLVFRVHANNPEGKLVRVSIESDELIPYEYDCSSQKTYLKDFDLSQLDDGIYKFKVSCGNHVVTRKVKISTETTTRRLTTIQD